MVRVPRTALKPWSCSVRIFRRRRRRPVPPFFWAHWTGPIIYRRRPPPQHPPMLVRITCRSGPPRMQGKSYRNKQKKDMRILFLKLYRLQKQYLHHWIPLNPYLLLHFAICLHNSNSKIWKSLKLQPARHYCLMQHGSCHFSLINVFLIHTRYKAHVYLYLYLYISLVERYFY